MGFTIFRTIMTIAVCCFLAMLFLLPSAALDRFSAEADAQIGRAETALISGDTDAAARYCEALAALVRERMPMLERFLNHSDIDELDAAVAVAACAARLDEPGAACEALAQARSLLVRIRGIEHFSWNNLL